MSFNFGSTATVYYLNSSVNSTTSLTTSWYDNNETKLYITMIVTKYQKHDYRRNHWLLNEELWKMHLIDGGGVSGGGTRRLLLLLRRQLRWRWHAFVLVTVANRWLDFIARCRDLVKDLAQLYVDLLRLHYNTATAAVNVPNHTINHCGSPME